MEMAAYDAYAREKEKIQDKTEAIPFAQTVFK